MLLKKGMKVEEIKNGEISEERAAEDAGRDSDRLGTEPIHGLLINMSLPLMLSMFIMALYNVVDSIFVAHISEDALTAVSLCYPFQNLNAAFGIGTAVGMNALLSRHLGARDYERADKVAQ